MGEGGQKMMMAVTPPMSLCWIKIAILSFHTIFKGCFLKILMSGHIDHGVNALDCLA